MSEKEEDARQRLMSELLGSVQQCQVRFGGKAELATENEEVVAKLCRSLEKVFSHGMRSAPRSNFALRQVTDMVAQNLGGLLQLNQGTGPNPTMWNFVKTHLNRHELERYMMLKSITNDSGRGRAWLRATLNEHSLERYVHQFVSNADSLNQFYENFAFLRDSERSAVLPSIAAGLGSILFAINIDNTFLNDVTDHFARHSTDEEAMLASSVSGSPKADSSKKPRKKGRKAAAKIIDFDNEVDEPSAEISTPTDSKCEVDITSINDTRHASPTPSLTYDPVQLRQTARNFQHDSAKNEDTEDDVDICSRSSVEICDSDATVSSSDRKEQGSRFSKLTPVPNVDVGALIPLSSGGPHVRDEVQSEDSLSMHSCGDESDYGSVFTDLPPSSAKPILQSSKSTAGASRASSVGGAISREDLKQALLSVMNRKDELQSQCSALKKLLEQESSATASLHEELKESKRRLSENNEKLNNRIKTLSRENELLKHQLKKYVGAVQKLRDGPMAYETLAQLDGQSFGSTNESTKYVDYHFEASEFEKKLIQVAEMHGELLEFNEYLQKQISAKDFQLKRLRDELIELRGPLPVDEDQADDAVSTISEADSMSTSIISSTSVNKLSLINIWIPSVFLSGSGSKTHHVYQVYIKIGLEEWNVYRRYSEFYGLHRDLQKREKSVASFDFPPKKRVGYKTDKVVEDRRKRLQAYLRCVMNLIVQKNPSLCTKPDKQHILLLMPFFADSSSRLGHSTTSPSMLTNSGSRLLQRSSAPVDRRQRSEVVPQLAL